MSLEAKTIAFFLLGFSTWTAVIWLISKVLEVTRND